MVSSVSFSKSEKQRHGVLYTLEAACNKILNGSGENGMSSQSSQRLLAKKLAEFEAELKKCQNAVGVRVSKLSGDKRSQALNSWEELSSPWENWLTNSFMLLENARTDQEEARSESSEVNTDTPATIIAGINSVRRTLSSVLNATVRELEARVEMIKSRIDCLDTPSLELKKTYQSIIQDVKQEVEGKLNPLLKELAQEESTSDLFDICISKKNSLYSSILDLNVSLAQYGSLSSPSATGYSYGTSLSHAPIKYREEEIPKFEGDVAKYPEFKREWQEAVQMGRPSAWIISNLDKRTPSDVSLLNCETVAQCWEELDAVYANPLWICQTLIDRFWKSDFSGNDTQVMFKIEKHVSTLVRTLQTVKAEQNFIGSLNEISKVLELFPHYYAMEFDKIRRAADKIVAEDPATSESFMSPAKLYSEMHKYLKDCRRYILMYRRKDLEEERLIWCQRCRLKHPRDSCNSVFFLKI